MTAFFRKCALAPLVLAPLAIPAAEVLTQHNNAARTGVNLEETILTPAALRSGRFGKLYDIPVDGFVYAQPLLVNGLTLNGRVRNVLYIATEHNSIYALDGESGEQLWMKNYGRPMPTPSVHFPVVGSNTPYRDLTPEIGITSTPVIDRETETLYFMTFVEERGPDVSWRHSLHAVDLKNGSEKFGGPADIQACVGSPRAAAINQGKAHAGRHFVNTHLCFDPAYHLQRVALLLVKPSGALPQIIFAFGAHADYPPFQGWVMSYQANDIRKQLGVWVTTTNNTAPCATGAGIWQSGMGPVLDSSNNVYFMTGNGPIDGDTSFGESFLRFSTAGNTIARTDYFTPCNQAALDDVDEDLGSSGPLLIADPAANPPLNFIVGGGKQGKIYVLNPGKLGEGFKTACGDNGTNRQIPQEFQATFSPIGHSRHIHGTPVYWNSEARGRVIYVWGETDHLRAYPLTLQKGQWRFDTFMQHWLRIPFLPSSPNPPSWAKSQAISPAAPWTPLRWMMTGGMLSLSANGGRDGVLWATTPTNNDANSKPVPGILRAYDATDLSVELWNSYQNPSRDDFGNFSKFTPVTVANGRVYVPTFSNRVSVYGLTNVVSPPAIEPLNLVLDPGFEEGILPNSSWKGTPDRFSHGINFPYSGTRSGVLCTALEPESGYTPDVCPSLMPVIPAKTLPPENSNLSQTVTAPRSGTYTLTARCATNILNNPHITKTPVTLSVLVRGVEAGRQEVFGYMGYQTYRMQFTANQGDPIEIVYWAPAVDTRKGINQTKLITPEAWAVIDDVKLTAQNP